MTPRPPVARTFPRLAAFVSLLCAAALSVGCTKKAPGLTSEAAAVFGLAEAKGPGGSLTIDLDGLRAQKLIPEDSEAQRQWVSEFAVSTLSSVAMAMKEEPIRSMAVRGAVVMGVLREWAAWPQVQRMGIFVTEPDLKAGALGMAESVVVALAVRGDRAANAELLAGLAALDRAGGQPVLEAADGRLCFASLSSPVPVCLLAGNGFLALASPAALDRLPAPGKGAPASVGGPLVRFAANVPGQGSGDVVIEWAKGLRLAGRVELMDQELASKLESEAKEALKKLDEGREELKQAVAPTLQQTQKALAEDAAAPPSVKRAAEGLTIDKLLDPGSSYAAVRSSIQFSRTDKVFLAEVTFPESQVRQVTGGSGLMAGVAVAGLLAAVAIPNYVKYGCKAKQAEAKAGLRSAFVAQLAFRAEHDRFATTFDELDFESPPGSRYTFCMNGACSGCTAPGCRRPPVHQNPCLTALPKANGMAICAVADLDGDADDFDVWTLDEGGLPEHAADDCD